MYKLPFQRHALCDYFYSTLHTPEYSTGKIIWNNKREIFGGNNYLPLQVLSLNTMKQILSLNGKSAHPAAQKTQIMILLKCEEWCFHQAKNISILLFFFFWLVRTSVFYILYQEETMSNMRTCGGFSRGMIKSTLIGWRSASGGSPLAISIAVIPRDQISACIKKRVPVWQSSRP